MDIEAVKAWPVKKQKDSLWVLYVYHVQDELCLVDILHKLHENGEKFTRQELLDDLARIIEAERVFINLLGRREAAKVYGAHEGVTSGDRLKTFDRQLEQLRALEAVIAL